jgi:hypothetical protein
VVELSRKSLSRTTLSLWGTTNQGIADQNYYIRETGDLYQSTMSTHGVDRFVTVSKIPLTHNSLATQAATSLGWLDPTLKIDNDATLLDITRVSIKIYLRFLQCVFLYMSFEENGAPLSPFGMSKVMDVHVRSWKRGRQVGV